MEIKKTPKADLENKKGIFLQIGLVLALLFSVAVFSYSQKEKKTIEIGAQAAVLESDMVEITKQEQKQPEPVKQSVTVTSDIINIVRNDAKVEGTLMATDYTEDFKIEPIVVKEEATQSEEVFIKVEKMPSFMGGTIEDFRVWVQKRLTYPRNAAEAGIQGTVTLTFVVEKDGSLTNIEALASPDRELTEEAIKVLKTSPKWTPGKQRNASVRVQYSLPVVFRIQNN